MGGRSWKTNQLFCDMESRRFYSKLLVWIETYVEEIFTKRNEQFYNKLYFKKQNVENIIEKLSKLDFNVLAVKESGELEEKNKCDRVATFRKIWEMKRAQARTILQLNSFFSDIGCSIRVMLYKKSQIVRNDYSSIKTRLKNKTNINKKILKVSCQNKTRYRREKTWTSLVKRDGGT